MRTRGVHKFFGVSLGLCAALGAGSCRQGSPRAHPAAEEPPNGRISPSLPSLSTNAPAAPSVVADNLEFLQLTTGQADPASTQPWILALHGLGDRPETFRQLFRDVNFAAHVYVVQAPIPYSQGFDWLGVRVSGPAAELAQAVQRAADKVEQLTESLARDPRNQGLPIVTGFSQGGYLSFAMAALHPKRVRAALPIAGGLPAPLWPTDTGEQLPVIIAFHGTADSVVPHAPAHAALRSLEAHHYRVAWHEYPGLGHQISSELFQDWERALAQQVASARAAKP